MLPEQGNIITIKLARDLKGKLELSQAEMKAADVKMVNEQLTWEPVEQEEDIKLSEAETELMVYRLNALDAEDELTEHHISLWDKFMRPPPNLPLKGEE